MTTNNIKSSKIMVKEARSAIDELTTQQVLESLSDTSKCIIDIRDETELIKNGVLPNSKHASRGKIEFFADPAGEQYKKFFTQEKMLILYCATGGRSALAVNTLKMMGYENVTHMVGGFKRWKKEKKIIDPYIPEEKE
jgi:rhodanese-related sulfurtransferase